MEQQPGQQRSYPRFTYRNNQNTQKKLISSLMTLVDMSEIKELLNQSLYQDNLLRKILYLR